MDGNRSNVNQDHSMQGENMSLREEAARQIVHRYTSQLKSLVRLLLNKKIRQKEGTSDLVQNVFKSFFNNDIDITDPKNFGTEFLTTITRRKCKNVAKEYKRKKRDYQRERNGIITTDGGKEVLLVDLECMAAGPGPEEAAMFIEKIEMLSEREQRVAMLLFEGYQITEIANQLSCSAKTIQREVKNIREKWKPTGD